MNKVLCIFVCLFTASQVQALSIVCKQDESFKQNASKINISYEWDNDIWAVLIRAPLKINDLPFGLANLVKDKNGNIFSAHLRTYENEGKIEAHFYANEEILEGMSLWLSYGEQCQQGFKLPLKHNKAVLSPSAGTR